MSSPGAPLPATFDRLYRELGGSLRRLAGAYARSSADAEDLFQEIWLAVWRSLPSFRGDCSERTFVFRIAHNRGITHRTRSRWRLEAALDGLTLSDPRPDPETALTDSARSERLFRAVRALPPEHRDVVLLSLEGLSNGEIGDVLGLSYGNVGVRLTRARQRLREELGETRDA